MPPIHPGPIAEAYEELLAHLNRTQRKDLKTKGGFYFKVGRVKYAIMPLNEFMTGNFNRFYAKHLGFGFQLAICNGISYFQCGYTVSSHESHGQDIPWPRHLLNTILHMQQVQSSFEGYPIDEEED